MTHMHFFYCTQGFDQFLQPRGRISAMAAKEAAARWVADFEA